MIIKRYFLSNLHKNLCCGCSSELPRQGESNEHQQHRFFLSLKYHQISSNTHLISSYEGYYLTGNNTHRASLDVSGLDVLLNHIRPKSINDPKLEKAQLPYQAFFLQQAVGTARGWF